MQNRLSPAFNEYPLNLCIYWISLDLLIWQLILLDIILENITDMPLKDSESENITDHNIFTSKVYLCI